MFRKKKYDPAAEAARRRQILLPPDDYKERERTAPKPQLPPAEVSRVSPSRLEYKQVRVPTGRGDKERILNKHAADGWTLVEIRSGGLIFGTKDVAILCRPKADG